MKLIKDSEFIRGNCPMTKEDIRALSIWKMNLKNDSIMLDIGSGTGTITVQGSKIVSEGKVYAVEIDIEAYETSLKNIEKFNCTNVEIHNTDGITFLNKAIENKINFDSIFIGGSGGDLEEIINKSISLLKDKGTLVMNFITLNNLYKGVERAKTLGLTVDITSVNISKNKGNSYMMIANNPIYIVQCAKEK